MSIYSVGIYRVINVPINLRYILLKHLNKSDAAKYREAILFPI